MKVIKSYPSRQLAQYIEYYWWIEADSLEESFKPEKILADSSLEIIFHFGDPVSRVITNEAIKTEPNVLLIGQTIKPYTILPSANTKMLGIRFLPQMGKYFFNIQLKEMNDTYFDLKDLWGTSIGEIHHEIASTYQLTKKIEIIERYLSKKINLKLKNNLLVGDTLKEMSDNNGNICIKELSIKRNITTRHLEKIFINDVGISPKLAARIIQFQHTLRLLKNTPETLTNIGLEGGYYDQAHFIKSFKMFADTTPSQFIKEYFPIQQLLEN
jgi:AraC-like DNA-binding protein